MCDIYGNLTFLSCEFEKISINKRQNVNKIFTISFNVNSGINESKLYEILE